MAQEIFFPVFLNIDSHMPPFDLCENNEPYQPGGLAIRVSPRFDHSQPPSVTSM
jgi:hypothetical protein